MRITGKGVICPVVAINGCHCHLHLTAAYKG